jgi:type III secretory pathway component EscU
MNLTIAIFINFIIAFLIPLILYLCILKPGLTTISEYILFPVVLFTVMFFVGFSTSYIASKEKCDSFSFLQSLINGGKSALAVCITYVIIFLLPEITFPFIKIFGSYANETIVSYIAQSILIAFSTLPATATVWLSSEKYGCYLSSSELKEIKDNIKTNLNDAPPDPNYKKQQTQI